MFLSSTLAFCSSPQDLGLAQQDEGCPGNGALQGWLLTSFQAWLFPACFSSASPPCLWAASCVNSLLQGSPSASCTCPSRPLLWRAGTAALGTACGELEGPVFPGVTWAWIKGTFCRISVAIPGDSCHPLCLPVPSSPLARG